MKIVRLNGHGACRVPMADSMMLQPANLYGINIKDLLQLKTYYSPREGSRCRWYRRSVS
jgi:hypothetical protein